MSSPIGTMFYSASLGDLILQSVSIEDSYAIAGGVFNLVANSNLTLQNVSIKNCSCLK